MSKCSLSVENLPESVKERSKVQPLSLKYDQMAQLITEVQLRADDLQNLGVAFGSKLLALQSGDITHRGFLELFCLRFNDLLFLGLIRPELCKLVYITKTNP